MTTPHPPIFVRTLILSLTLFAILSCWSDTSWADSSSESAASAGELPGGLGAIVYQKNPELPVQVFIIGNCHRSSISGENDSQTVPAQLQTYRIAEWLIRQHQVELLLPEGFFGQKERTKTVDVSALRPEPALEEELADTSTFVNADLLLHRNYGIALHQIEDRDLYRTARDYLHFGLKSGASRRAPFGLELTYLQERRSAAILQRIPAAIITAYHQGQVAQPRAILTIGMAHLDEIIKFLELGRIEISAPPIGGSGFQDYSETLELLAQKVGVTVIVPRAILDDRETRYLAKLAPQTAAKKPGIFRPGEI